MNKTQYTDSDLNIPDDSIRTYKVTIQTSTHLIFQKREVFECIILIGVIQLLIVIVNKLVN